MLKVILFVVLAGIVATVLWQHFRYLNIRRDILEDRQPILYSADAFHAVTFVKVTADQSALEELRKLKDVVTAHSDATVVYAGLGTPIRTSSQVPSDWNALMLVQYPSRSAFDVMAADNEYQQLLAI
jgi:hypothetical protein